MTTRPAVLAKDRQHEPAYQNMPRQWLQYEAEDRQRQQRQRAGQAYEADLARVRQRQQYEAANLWRPPDVEPDHDILGRIHQILAGASQNQQAHQQRQWIEQQNWGAEAMSPQQVSQELDKVLEQQRQQVQSYLRQPR
jgi:hypothetical protein